MAKVNESSRLDLKVMAGRRLKQERGRRGERPGFHVSVACSGLCHEKVTRSAAVTQLLNTLYSFHSRQFSPDTFK